jgi:triosephosphate isomerase
MRTPFLAANWKMNMTRREARNLVEDLLKTAGPVKGREVLIAPPFQLLAELEPLLKGQTNYHLGAQNLHWEKNGAFTGEVSAPMLRDCGCTFVIIGHSERRAMFGDTNETCARKVAAALAEGLTPVLCVGETLAEREAGKTKEVNVGQLSGSLKGISVDSGSKLVVAYEPVWAIGTGKTDTPENANQTMAVLREELARLFGERVAQQVRLLYGGSVKPDNVDAFMAMPHIDGALVGGASLKADSFARIVGYQATEEARK